MRAHVLRLLRWNAPLWVCFLAVSVLTEAPGRSVLLCVLVGAANMLGYFEGRARGAWPSSWPAVTHLSAPAVRASSGAPFVTIREKGV